MIRVGDVVIHENLNKAAVVIGLVYSPETEQDHYDGLRILLDFNEDVNTTEFEGRNYTTTKLYCNEGDVTVLEIEQILELISKGLKDED